MTLTLQIAIGIWLGGVFLIGSVTAFFVTAERISKNKRYGRPWWRGLLTIGAT